MTTPVSSGYRKMMNVEDRLSLTLGETIENALGGLNDQADVVDLANRKKSGLREMKTLLDTLGPKVADGSMTKATADSQFFALLDKHPEIKGIMSVINGNANSIGTYSEVSKKVGDELTNLSDLSQQQLTQLQHLGTQFQNAVNTQSNMFKKLEEPVSNTIRNLA